MESVKSHIFSYKAKPKAVPGSISIKSNVSPSEGEQESFRTLVGTLFTSRQHQSVCSTQSFLDPPDGKIENTMGKKQFATNAGKMPYRTLQFHSLLDAENIDMAALRKLSWNGVPSHLRPAVWQILLGYLPTNKGVCDCAEAQRIPRLNTCVFQRG